MSKKTLDPTKPLVNVALKRTAEMLKKYLAAAHAAWIAENPHVEERQRRERSSFLKYQNDQGHYADSHALRKTIITNLSRAGVSPKTAESEQTQPPRMSA